MKIYVSNTKYVVETVDGKLHILTRKAMVWHVKNYLNLKGEQGKALMSELDRNGYAVVAA